MLKKTLICDQKGVSCGNIVLKYLFNKRACHKDESTKYES